MEEEEGDKGGVVVEGFDQYVWADAPRLFIDYVQKKNKVLMNVADESPINQLIWA